MGDRYTQHVCHIVTRRSSHKIKVGSAVGHEAPDTLVISQYTNDVINCPEMGQKHVERASPD